MFMQSNQPFQQDSVLDGALLGGAIGAGAMYGATKAAPGLEKYATKQGTAAREEMKTHASAMRNDVQQARQLSFDSDMKKAKTPGAVNVTTVSNNAAAAGAIAAKDHKSMEKFNAAKSEYKTNKSLGKLSKNLSSGSTRTRAAMYGGSVIAGALGGAMIDKGN